MDAVFSRENHLTQHGVHISNPHLRNFQSFLKSGMLLVKITDKNLGLAVITKDWYREEVQKYLCNQKTYFKCNDFMPDPSLQEILNIIRY